MPYDTRRRNPGLQGVSLSQHAALLAEAQRTVMGRNRRGNRNTAPPTPRLISDEVDYYRQWLLDTFAEEAENIDLPFLKARSRTPSVRSRSTSRSRSTTRSIVTQISDSEHSARLQRMVERVSEGCFSQESSLTSLSVLSGQMHGVKVKSQRISWNAVADLERLTGSAKSRRDDDGSSSSSSLTPIEELEAELGIVSEEGEQTGFRTPSRRGSFDAGSVAATPRPTRIRRRTSSVLWWSEDVDNERRRLVFVPSQESILEEEDEAVFEPLSEEAMREPTPMSEEDASYIESIYAQSRSRDEVKESLVMRAEEAGIFDEESDMMDESGTTRSATTVRQFGPEGTPIMDDVPEPAPGSSTQAIIIRTISESLGLAEANGERLERTPEERRFFPPHYEEEQTPPVDFPDMQEPRPSGDGGARLYRADGCWQLEGAVNDPVVNAVVSSLLDEKPSETQWEYIGHAQRQTTGPSAAPSPQADPGTDLSSEVKEEPTDDDDDMDYEPSSPSSSSFHSSQDL
ncbi:hypothetical protein K474DRAFT_1674752 [Panus rudis PR-1116 ss-1]|nr:hypothetical protein K474DRAFT_1674752 [Panus rudis PR-1116 ss-1]